MLNKNAQQKVPTFDQIKNRKEETSEFLDNIYNYYLKIWKDSGSQPAVFFDYKDNKRNYNLINRRDQELIQQAILSQPTNQVRGLRENPFGQLDTPLTEDRESNPGSGTFGKYSKNN